MSTALDEDIIVLEDLDLDPTCELKVGCDKVATWAMIRKCCSHASLFCDEHVELSRKYVRDEVMAFDCKRCSAKMLRGNDFWWRKL